MQARSVVPSFLARLVIKPPPPINLLNIVYRNIDSFYVLIYNLVRYDDHREGWTCFLFTNLAVRVTVGLQLRFDIRLHIHWVSQLIIPICLRAASHSRGATGTEIASLERRVHSSKRLVHEYSVRNCVAYRTTHRTKHSPKFPQG